MGDAGGTFDRRSWLDGSAFATDGEPTVFHHGTDVESPFNVFTRWEGDASIGFHFGTREAAEYRVNDIFRMAAPEERGGRIVEVICRARNPLRLPDLMTWSQTAFANALFDAGLIGTQEEWDHVVDSCDAETIFAVLEEAGYDAVVYRNDCEHREGAADSLFVWRAELLKDPSAESYDKADPRLRPGVRAPGEEIDLEEWRRLGARIDEAREDLRRLRESATPRGP